MKHTQKIWLTAAFVALAGLGGIRAPYAQEAVRIGTSSVGSIFYTMAVGVSEVIHKNSGVNSTVQPVGGSTANIFGLKANKVDFALANAFASYTGFHGTHKFKGKPVDLRLVAQAQTSMRYFLVRKDANIKSPKDFIGKTIIAKRRALPELEIIMDEVIKAYDLPRDKIKLVATTNSGEAYKALAVGSVHAALMPFGLRSASVMKAIRDGSVAMLPMSKDKRDQVLTNLPSAFFAVDVKKDFYDGHDRVVHMFGLNAYFITRANVSDETVYKVAKGIFDNTKQLTTYHKAGRFWTAKRALSNLALPLHPGAIKYFKQKGLWTADLENKQKAAMKR